MVQKKHNDAPTSTYWNTPQAVPVIDKERPGAGHRHYLRKRDLVDFIGILPDWPELSVGLDAIVLSAARGGTDGWYDLGVVGVCAWPKDPWCIVPPAYHREHEELFRRLGVECEDEQLIWDRYMERFGLE